MLPKIDFPIYELKLISNEKTIRFRPFLVKEQKLLMMATESDNAKDSLNVVKQICKNCVIDDIDIDSLPVFDLEFIFLNLRARSINEVVNLQYKCNNTVKKDDGSEDTCNSVEKFEVNLLDIKPIQEENHNKKIMLSEKLGIMMKYPTFESVTNIKGNTESEILIDLIISSIDFIFDEEKIYYAKDSTKEEMEEFIDSLQQKDLEKLQLFFETAPKLKHTINFGCKKCGYKENIDVEGLQNFFV